MVASWPAWDRGPGRAGAEKEARGGGRVHIDRRPVGRVRRGAVAFLRRARHGGMWEPRGRGLPVVTFVHLSFVAESKGKKDFH